MGSKAAMMRQIDYDIGRKLEAIEACKELEQKLRDELYTLKIRKENYVSTSDVMEGQGDGS